MNFKMLDPKYSKQILIWDVQPQTYLIETSKYWTPRIESKQYLGMFSFKISNYQIKLKMLDPRHSNEKYCNLGCSMTNLFSL